MICADFAQFLRSFSTMRNFAQIFAITNIFAQEINFHQGQNFLVWDTGWPEFFEHMTRFFIT